MPLAGQCRPCPTRLIETHKARGTRQCRRKDDTAMFTIVGILAALVLTGSLFTIYGARHTRMPSRALTIAFAITAASWLAFLVAAIGAVLMLLALPRA